MAYHKGWLKIKWEILLIVLCVKFLYSQGCNKKTDSCKCQQKTYDFSGRHMTYKDIQRLTFQNETSCVNFNNNNITELSTGIFLRFPKSLKYMYLGHCNIFNIAHNRMFENLTNLRVLDIRYNKLTNEAIHNLFQSIANSSVRILDISGNVVVSSCRHTLSYYNFKIKNLRMNDCNISNLTNILETNKTNIYLKVLEMKRNFFNELQIQNFESYGHLYPRLSSLKISSNPIQMVSANVFNSLRNLNRLWLDGFESASTFNGVNNSELLFLDISKSFLFDPNQNYKKVFEYSKKLITLNISSTNFSNWLPFDLYEMFLPLQNISTLLLTNISITNIPCNIVTNFLSLEILDISRNEIVDWSTNCFKDVTPKLKKLYLSGNRIRTITEDSFPPRFLQQLEKLHLDGNSFRCDCSIHWFRYWMKDQYKKLDAFSPDNTTFFYVCTSPEAYKDTLLVDYDPFYEECFGLTIEVTVAFCICGLSVAFVLAMNILQTFKILPSKDIDAIF